jgi:hypothetical protein
MNEFVTSPQTIPWLFLSQFSAFDARNLQPSQTLPACRFQAVCLSGQGSSGKARFSEHTELIPLGMMRQIPKPKTQSTKQAISRKAPNRMS